MGIHNTIHHDGGAKDQVGLYNSCTTQSWEIRVFAFFIACTEVNSFLCLKYFLNKDEEFSVFRLILAYNLIHIFFLGNRSDRDNLEKPWKNQRVHHLETAPSHAKEWRGSNWDCSAKYGYQQYICHGKNCKTNENILQIWSNFLAMQGISHISWHGEQYLRIIDKLNSVLTFW